ncbi:MAG: glycosyltransferase family 2 protein [Candidatus Heimdallarchaeota archaeon]
MYKGKKIGIVVPAYNEEKLISSTLGNIPTFADMIYVTDDCSKDKTTEIVKTFALKDKRVKLIQHNKNRGVGGAIVSGFKDAIAEEMDIVAVMAGDNQMDAKHLTALLDPIIENEAEFTKGNRLKAGYWKGMSLFRLTGNIILTILNQIVTGYWGIRDPQNGYIAISVESLKKIDLDSLYKGYAFENDLMLKSNIINLRMKNILIPALYGVEKSSIKYGRFIVKTLMYFVKAYYWRIWHKYIKKFNPIGILIILGFLGLIAGIIVGIVLSFQLIWPIFVVSASLFLISFLTDGLSSIFRK